MSANALKNAALSEVLDGAGHSDHQHDGLAPEDAAASGEEQVTLYQEHMARLKAEAEAQDTSARLRVAQEQLAEYATQKQKDAAVALQQAEALQRALQELLQRAGDAATAAEASSSGNGYDGAAASVASAAAVAATMHALQQRLVEAAEEAAAFAEQQTADVERYKRSSQQAELPAAEEGGDVEMKRLRETDDAEAGSGGRAAVAANGNGLVSDSDTDDEELEDAEAAPMTDDVPTPSTSYSDFAERARYIPLRLSLEDRRLLRLLEAALNVSEYTDKVDVLTWRNKSGRIHAQIKDICAILCGLVVAQDYRRGQELIADHNFKDNADFFANVFEIGRRYKVMNPEKMRSEYGKLMYLLMDSSKPEIQELLEFKCVRPLKTVYSLLQAKGGLRLLEDPLMRVATAEIPSAGRSRYDIQRDIKIKERAREQLAKRYRTTQLSEEDILWCLYSFSDNNSFLLFNRDPIDRMISYFTTYFSPDAIEPGYSLAISGGKNGARLTHSHERQYHYVLQSLTLWRSIMNDMFKLWYLAESDMLRESNTYRLCDTGQGLNRVQAAPAVGRAMNGILGACQQALGHWVGSAVVHLGDHNVPSALMFIDKYTQVPRILNPVVLVLDELPKLYQQPNLQHYIDDTFGGLEQCRKSILADFCRHAFDGSGADNFFSAGSCIDGRLTSAWNWCSKLEKKSYFHLFRMAGFVSFDGDFQK